MPQPASNRIIPIHPDSDVFTRWNREDLRKIAHIKRCVERYRGDPEFRAGMSGSGKERRKLVEAHGANIASDDIAPLLRKGCSYDKEEMLTFSPLTKLWDEWNDWTRTKLIEIGDEIDGSIVDPRYRAWRRRQIARCDWELGPQNQYFGHIPATFELSKGCSMGCWFCGIDARKLEGVFVRTPEHRSLWQEILCVCRDKLSGHSQGAFCYWATEPTDNPDYLDYLDDYREIFGMAPATTTAAPMRNLDWTRSLMRLSANRHAAGCRFSVTSLSCLRQIHATFTPEELLGVNLVLQNPESIVRQRRTGRRRRSRQSDQPGSEKVVGAYDAGTISCVTGFLVNMVARDIRLISPCHASKRWPLGYRVYWECSFRDAQEFGDGIEEAMARHMPESLKGDQIARFNEHLCYERTAAGFKLESPFRIYMANDNPALNELAELVGTGEMTVAQIIQELANREHNPIAVTDLIQYLFDKGLIDDDLPTDTRDLR